MDKKSAYEHVREVEHASFTPLVMSATGSLVKEATNFCKRLVSHLAEKWDQPHSHTMNWLRCTLFYSLHRSINLCVGSARSTCGNTIKVSPVDLVCAEAYLHDFEL